MTVFEPSHSFRLRTEARTSNLPGAGRGIFALEGASAGDFLGMDFPNPVRITGEAAVLDLPIEIRMYSWRQIEHLCFAAIGRLVNGWEWRHAVVESCRKMIELLERTGDS